MNAFSFATFSFGRVGAMCLRHFYVLKGSWPRLIEMAYWPTMQMIIWGFFSTFLYRNSTWLASAFGVLLAAVMLWDVLFRGQLGFSLSFLEELWSRNLANLYCSPLTPVEHVASLLVMALIRALIGVLPATVLAIPFYHFSIFSLGPPLAAFFFCLILMGCSMGMIVTAMIMRFGLAAENLAWFIVFLLAPVSAVYYPVSILPHWLQVVAGCLPSSYVFEGMRAVMFDHVFRWDLFAWSVGLNVVYLALGLGIYLWSFARARQLGLLLQVGE
ncbi:MAG TPA: ABC transporter permease [Dongiaceae bacterium]|jgi:ABC-2 type transport system permease protein|nr:ABC transporter permease [Dongiaceae bacterium]